MYSFGSQFPLNIHKKLGTLHTINAKEKPALQNVACEYIQNKWTASQVPEFSVYCDS